MSKPFQNRPSMKRFTSIQFSASFFLTATLLAGVVGAQSAQAPSAITEKALTHHVSDTADPVGLRTLRSIKTVFLIPIENHDFVQSYPTSTPQQLLGNPACPYFNSLITPGNSNAAHVSYATHYYSCSINGEHPSEPNYVWSEAGTDFGVRTDHDPSDSVGNLFHHVMHLSGQLTAAGIPWRSYQEDLEYISGPAHSASGSGVKINPYNGTTKYSYAAKHNPMAFFPDTQNFNVYPMTNLWADLENNNVGRYNWVTPDQYNEMHSALPGGFVYHGTRFAGNQAAIAEGDNALSMIIPRIMKSKAYRDHGVIIIWTDETVSTDDTNTTLPFVVNSPLAKGNAYASTLPYSHSSTLKTMDEIFGVDFQTNAIPADRINALNSGYDYVDGRSAPVHDLSDLFKPVK
jgi:phosphatidylinositol-3-phosphatase